MTGGALLLDNDGVLLERTGDDHDAFEAAVRRAFRDHGVDNPEPDHVRNLVYDVTVPYVTAVCEQYGLDREAFWRSRDEACSEVQREAIRNGEKGLYPDVAVLADLSRQMGVVSTNQQPTLAFAFDHLRAPAFDVVQGRPMTIESLRRKKPEPHYIEEALTELDAETALYVGDSEHDIVAAHNAGIEAAFLRRDHNRETVLSVSPEYELDSLRELPAILV